MRPPSALIATLLTERAWPVEGVGELAEEGCGHGGVAAAEAFGQLAFGEVEGAEEQVEGGEGGREVPVEPLLLAGVMPAVEDGAGQDVAEGAERPVEVG